MTAQHTHPTSYTSCIHHSILSLRTLGYGQMLEEFVGCVVVVVIGVVVVGVAGCHCYYWLPVLLIVVTVGVAVVSYCWPVMIRKIQPSSRQSAQLPDPDSRFKLQQQQQKQPQATPHHQHPSIIRAPTLTAPLLQQPSQQPTPNHQCSNHHSTNTITTSSTFAAAHLQVTMRCHQNLRKDLEQPQNSKSWRKAVVDFVVVWLLLLLFPSLCHHIVVAVVRHFVVVCCCCCCCCHYGCHHCWCPLWFGCFVMVICWYRVMFFFFPRCVANQSVVFLSVL